MKFEINTIAALIGAGVTYFLGGWDIALQALVIFMILDYLTGVIIAYNNKSLSSSVGMRGLSKKLLVIFILIGAVHLDRLLGLTDPTFRTIVCYFYIANEGISLTENAVKLGLPVPKKIVELLEQLKNKSEEEIYEKN